jgi:hypothetical protein
MTADALSARFRAAAKRERSRPVRAGGWRRRSLARAFELGVRLQVPWLSAQALLRTALPMAPAEAGQVPVWILSKEGLVEDAQALVANAAWAAPHDFSRLCLKLVAERYLPKHLDDNQYADADPAVEEAKRALRWQWRRILRALPPSRRPAAVITSNFGYFVEREFAGACEAEGIPFIAIHKECFKAPGRLRFFATTYPRRGAFTGRRVLVYNDYERDLLVDSGIVTRAAVSVTGMPRLDRLHAWRRANGLRPRPARLPTLLAFAFTPAAGLPRIPRKERTGIAGGLDAVAPEFAGLAWERLFAQYHAALVRIARENPDMRVLLKVKGRERDGRPAIELIESLDRPSNLEIAVGGDPFDLLVVADAVTGFNTTALCEAIAAGLPVVVPDFAEAVEGVTAEYVVDLGDAVVHARSPEEFVALAVALARGAPRGPDLDPVRETALRVWVGNADGRAAQRTIGAIRSECGTAV